MTNIFSPDYYEMYDEDYEAFMRGEFNDERTEEERREDERIAEEDEVIANWQEAQEIFENRYQSMIEEEEEDRHLELSYEDRFAMWDDDPNPYFGDYSEL